MNIVITGRSGRMGLSVAEAVEDHPDASIHGTHDTGEELGPLLDGADVVIDFTIHSFTAQLLEHALATTTALVIGTTGHDENELAAIQDASGKIPIVFAPNFSIGVNTLFWLTRHAARILDNNRFDIEVTEMHHRHKIDAPSGTARRLLEILNRETDTSYQATAGSESPGHAPIVKSACTPFAVEMSGATTPSCSLPMASVWN